MQAAIGFIFAFLIPGADALLLVEWIFFRTDFAVSSYF